MAAFELIGAFGPGLSLEITTSSVGGQVLDGTDDMVALRFQAQSVSAITAVIINIDRVDGTPPTYKLGLQGLDSGGEPSGTYLGGGSEASTTFTPVEGDEDTLKQITLDNSYTPSLGEELCVVVEYSSGTIDSSNDITVNFGPSGHEAAAPTACTSTNAGSLWSEKTVRSNVSVVTGSGNYGWLALTYGGTGTLSTSGHRAAARFTVPTSTTTTYKLAGLVGWVDSDPCKIAVWEGTTEKASLSATLHTNTSRGSFFYFDSHVALNAGTEYMIGAEHSGNAVNYATIDCDTAAVAAGWAGGNGLLSTYNGTSWTDDDTQLALFWPIFADLTCSGGGGSGGGPLVNGGLVRG